MSRNYLVQAHLEYLVEQGLKKGLTEKQAVDYANNIFFSKTKYNSIKCSGSSFNRSGDNCLFYVKRREKEN